MSKRHSRLSLSGPTWKELGKSWTNWKSTTLFRSHKELRSQAKLLLWKPESQGDRENQSFLEAEGCGWRRDWGEPHSGAAGGSVWSSQKGPVFKGLYTFVSFNLMTRPGSQSGDCRKIPCSCTSRKKGENDHFEVFPELPLKEVILSEPTWSGRRETPKLTRL